MNPIVRIRGPVQSDYSAATAGADGKTKPFPAGPKDSYLASAARIGLAPKPATLPPSRFLWGLSSKLDGCQNQAEIAGLVADHVSSYSTDQIAQFLKMAVLEAQTMPIFRGRLRLGAQYVHMGRLVPGQSRLAMRVAADKVAEATGRAGLIVHNGKVQPAHHGGRAIVPLSWAKHAVAGPMGMVLVTDGNHQASASFLSGATHVPVDIVKDCQDMSVEAFFELAKDEGWTYYRQRGGKAIDVDLPSYATIQNDPLRLVMRRLRGSDKDPGLWNKVPDKAVDYVEFILADVLYKRLAKKPKDKVLWALKNVDAELRAGIEDGPAFKTLRKYAKKSLAKAVKKEDLRPKKLGIEVLPKN